jgi:hypothetical protein
MEVHTETSVAKQAFGRGILLLYIKLAIPCRRNYLTENKNH